MNRKNPFTDTLSANASIGLGVLTVVLAFVFLSSSFASHSMQLLVTHIVIGFIPVLAAAGTLISMMLKLSEYAAGILSAVINWIAPLRIQVADDQYSSRIPTVSSPPPRIALGC